VRDDALARAGGLAKNDPLRGQLQEISRSVDQIRSKVRIGAITRRLNAGRERCAAAKRLRDAAAAVQ
jgi:hypothetical protein